jgi:tetratricopeptide (TPR) repeat protein
MKPLPLKPLLFCQSLPSIKLLSGKLWASILALVLLSASIPLYSTVNANELVRYHWPEYQQTGESDLAHKHYAAAEVNFLKARQELLKHGQENLELAQTYVSLGQLYQETQVYEKAEQSLLKAIEIQIKRSNDNQLTTAKTLLRLSKLYEQWGREPQSIEAKEKALVLNPSVIPTNTATIALEDKSQEPSSILTLSASIQTAGLANRPSRPKLFGYDASSKTHTDWSAYLNQRGLADLQNESFDDAENHFKMAIYRWTYSSGPRSQRVPQILNNLAAVYDLQGRYGESEPYYTEALKLAKLTNGVQSPEFVQIYNNLVQVYQAQGKANTLQQLEAQYYPERIVSQVSDIPEIPIRPTLSFNPVPSPAKKPTTSGKIKKKRKRKKH